MNGWPVAFCLIFVSLYSNAERRKKKKKTKKKKEEKQKSRKSQDNTKQKKVKFNGKKSAAQAESIVSCPWASLVLRIER